MSSTSPRSHAELDKEVNDSHEWHDGELSIHQSSYLLTAIVEKSDGLLNSDYEIPKKARGLLQGNPALQEELKKAWNEKSYKRIRDLDILKPLTPPTKPTGAFGLDTDDTQVIQEAWEVKYSGESHKLLLNNINAMDRKLPHTNYVAIVQSSGTGKSRMVDELAKEVFTLPFNLRTTESFFAFPEPDHQIRTFFMGLLNSPSSVKECQIRLWIFFRHLFDAASAQFSSMMEKTSASAKGSKESIALAWRGYLSTSRSTLYDTVVMQCNQVQQGSQSLAKLLEVLHSNPRSPADPRTVKVMIYFDEAHVLGEPVERLQTLFDILCSALSDFSEHPLFSIFLSTHSSLSLLAPPGPKASSERAKINSDKLQPPITEIPFDCFPELMIRPKSLGLEALSEIEFLAQWGRPLWWSMQVAKEQRSAKSSLIDFARMKLLCRQDISVGHDQVSLTALTAVVDVMLMLQYEPRHELSHKAQVNMVTSHMRIAYSVPKHRTSFRSGYPSEPILAEAAMQQAHQFQTGADKASKLQEAPAVNVMLKTLGDNLTSGLLDQGQRGELVMRCLLVQAYMNAVVEEGGHACFSRGCKLVTFMRQLFADKYATEILGSCPDNAKSDKTFEEQFKHSVVRFTHFVKAVDNSAPTTPAVFAAFVRGMAFICHDQQNAVDLVIPVLLNEKDHLQESVMSAILIQVKRRTKASSADTFAFKQEDVGLFYFESPNDNRPYITIIAELGVRVSSTPAAETKTIVLSLPKKPVSGGPKSKPARKPRSPPQTPSRVHVSPQPESIHHGAAHPRYSLTAYGCSETVYKVIRPGEKYLYQNLLAASHLLGDHGRLDAKSLSAVRRMKPFWSIGNEFYHWIENSALHLEFEAESTDGLFVGRYDDASE